MPPQVGYYIQDKAAIKARTPDKRTNGYTRATSTNNNAEWYMFVAASTSDADNDNVLMPDDNPPTGRWHKYAANRGASGGLGAKIICTSQCSSSGGGKALQFYAPGTFELVIVPGFDISIGNSENAIAIYRWSQEPNLELIGKETTPIATLPAAGGKAAVTIDSTYRWINIFTLNPNTPQGEYLDAACFEVFGNVIIPLGYQ